MPEKENDVICQLHIISLVQPGYFNFIKLCCKMICICGAIINTIQQPITNCLIFLIGWGRGILLDKEDFPANYSNTPAVGWLQIDKNYMHKLYIYKDGGFLKK